MTPQWQQAVKILRLFLPELEAMVQNELDALDQSVAKAAGIAKKSKKSK